MNLKAKPQQHPIDMLLDRLDGVHIVSHGRWRARCPAHQGGNRDVLSLAENADGAVLIKCFAGCSVEAVVAAIELELSDLFPAFNWRGRDGHHLRARRRPRIDWTALVQAAEVDILVVKILLADIARGEMPSDEDRTAASSAATRLYRLIQEARDG